MFVRGWVKFVPALAYLPGTSFTKPRTNTLTLDKSTKFSPKTKPQITNDYLPLYPLMRHVDLQSSAKTMASGSDNCVHNVWRQAKGHCDATFQSVILAPWRHCFCSPFRLPFSSSLKEYAMEMLPDVEVHG